MEKECLETDAKRCVLTRNAYLRKLITGGEIKERPNQEIKLLRTEIHQIGNNINQFTRMANACGANAQDVRHIRYNSVSARTGKKVHFDRNGYYAQFRARSDGLCRKYGLSVIAEEHTEKASSYIEWLRQSRGEPTFRSMLERENNLATLEDMEAYQAKAEESLNALIKRLPYSTCERSGVRNCTRLWRTRKP